MRDDLRHLSEQDLVRAIDRELPPRRQADAVRHLDACGDCRALRARIERAAGLATAYCLSEDAGHELEHGRQRLRARLAAEDGPGWTGAGTWLPLPSTAMRTRIVVAVAAMAMVVLVRAIGPADFTATPADAPADALPVAALTPGATWSVTVAELCGGDGRPQRALPAAVRHDVLRGYGMEQVPADLYELDYLITPELGGAADARNLWPQRYGSRVWNAHVKDQLEELLPRLVCSGEVPLRTAQRDLAVDWVAAYKKYFDTDRPLPRQARLDADGDDGPITYPVWRSSSAPALELISFSASR